MFIDKLSEFTIRRHANAKSCQKGEAYYEAGAVLNIIQRGNILQAEVEGNQAKLHCVKLHFNRNGLATVSCTCNSISQEWCKHIVATMLVCLRQPEKILQRPTLTQMLDSLDRVETQKLLQELVAENPQIIETIDRYVSWMVNPTPTKQPISSYSTIDVVPFQRQVRQILADALNYCQDCNDRDLITEELLSLVHSAIELSERGEGHNAIALLEAITSTCVIEWNIITNYTIGHEKINEALNNAWCEAILSTALTPAEKVDIQVNLKIWQDQWNVDFSKSLAALDQNWADRIKSRSVDDSVD